MKGFIIESFIPLPAPGMQNHTYEILFDDKFFNKKNNKKQRREREESKIEADREREDGRLQAERDERKLEVGRESKIEAERGREKGRLSRKRRMEVTEDVGIEKAAYILKDLKLLIGF